jgi:hypothetical protein
MTSPAAPATPAAPAVQGGPAGQTLPDGPSVAARLREWRTPIAIIVFVLLAGTVIALLQPSAAVVGYLSPDDTSPAGTHALADILGERGHDVHTVTTVPAAVSAATGGTTLVITSPYLLSHRQLRALGRSPADLVIVEPDEDTLNTLVPRVSLAESQQIGVLIPACRLQAAVLAGAAEMGGPGMRVGPGAPDAAQCYISGGLPTLVQLRSGGRLVTVLSTGTPLSNAHLAQQGNAALAINLLSDAGPVIWLVPQLTLPPAGASPGSRPLTSLVPLAAWLVAIQLGVAVLLTAAWRARRLGPLIAERLPVVVRASETVEGHARLYQSRRARERVATALRAAAIARLAPAVGLPAGAAPEAVIGAVAARSVLDPTRVGELLYGPPPGNDATLVTLASDLDTLEGEVRRL